MCVHGRRGVIGQHLAQLVMVAHALHVEGVIGAGVDLDRHQTVGRHVRERHNAEAETVRRIFALYRELGCVRRVKEEADHLGLRTKCRTAANGTERGGKPFSRGHLYTLLSNPIYTGQIVHKDQLHPGQQPALIDDASWSMVRDQLAANTRDHWHRAKAAEPSLLAGLLVDARGERLSPSHAVKKGRRYRY